ncbi:hypothetical protein TIFTF001_002595 [Ficus carica]|uniref:Uncharacterized protein n=1 Tax=Ficus carica TaxID=3494 RepID=A0AA87ZNN3_FICCA|nr:hypothetical protein TIFTF001_002595 [Ficus carica]
MGAKQTPINPSINKSTSLNDLNSINVVVGDDDNIGPFCLVQLECGGGGDHRSDGREGREEDEGAGGTESGG